MMSVGTVTLAAPASRQWVLPIVALVMLSTLWGVLYSESIAAAVQAWWVSPTYSHCFFIIPISAYLVWSRRHELTCLTPTAYPRALWILAPAGAAWFMGDLASVNEVQQFAVVALFQMVVLCLIGPAAYRTILFPCLFLFFLVPVGQYLVPPLQSVTTYFVSGGLSLLGILHYTEGNIIELGNGRFEVAEACAGLRFLISNIVLCTLFAYYAFRGRTKIAVFMVAAVVVPILGNGLRALGIVLIAHWTDNKLAVGADHLVYGWGFSVAILLLLFGMGARFRDSDITHRPLLYFTEPSRASRTRLFLTALCAALLLALPPVLAQARARQFPASEPALAVSPLPGWTKTRLVGAWAPNLPGADGQIRLSLLPPHGDGVDYVLNYYSDDTHASAISDSQLWDERHYNLVATRMVQEKWRDKSLVLRELVLSSASEHRLIWWCYWKDGKFSPSGAVMKLLFVKNAFRAHTGMAIMVFSTPVRKSEDTARSALRASLWTVNMFPSDKAD